MLSSHRHSFDQVHMHVSQMLSEELAMHSLALVAVILFGTCDSTGIEPWYEYDVFLNGS